MGQVGMVGAQWTRVHEDGEFVYRLFPRRSQTDRQPGTVELMRRRTWLGGDGRGGGGQATEEGTGGRGRAERRKEEGRQQKENVKPRQFCLIKQERNIRLCISKELQ